MKRSELAKALTTVEKNAGVTPITVYIRGGATFTGRVGPMDIGTITLTSELGRKSVVEIVAVLAVEQAVVA